MTVWVANLSLYVYILCTSLFGSVIEIDLWNKEKKWLSLKESYLLWFPQSRCMVEPPVREGLSILTWWMDRSQMYFYYQHLLQSEASSNELMTVIVIWQLSHVLIPPQANFFCHYHSKSLDKYYHYCYYYFSELSPRETFSWTYKFGDSIQSWKNKVVISAEMRIINCISMSCRLILSRYV